jgi:hypothetical protein
MGGEFIQDAVTNSYIQHISKVNLIDISRTFKHTRLLCAALLLGEHKKLSSLFYYVCISIDGRNIFSMSKSLTPSRSMSYSSCFTARLSNFEFVGTANKRDINYVFMLIMLGKYSLTAFQ